MVDISSVTSEGEGGREVQIGGGKARRSGD